MSHARRVHFDVARNNPCHLPPMQPNRRNSERFVPAEDRAWLGWWEGSVFRTTEASLQNISKGGALVKAGLQPPRRASIWICLEGPRRTEWVDGRILEVTREADGVRVRIQFDGLCPYAFFEVAVYGWSAARPLPIVSPNDTARPESSSSLPMLVF